MSKLSLYMLLIIVITTMLVFMIEIKSVQIVLVIIEACALTTMIFNVFNLPVNGKGLRFKDAIKQFPKWKE